VMSQGRIEQIDAPHALYTAPRTRFVAGFVGRTNFIEGKCDGEQVVFDSFALPRRSFKLDDRDFVDKLVFSVRPQSIALHHAARPPGEAQHMTVGQVIERVFLGETWEYVVAPADSGLRLKITTSPVRVFDVGEKVWLEFDPQQMTLIT
jgi:ABC-type Fe3+/spermidine/putrescine transport system ATPase subunit